MFLLKVINGQPELNKIVALSKIRGLFPQNPFVSGFGNKVSPFTFYDSASPSYIPDNEVCKPFYCRSGTSSPTRPWGSSQTGSTT